MQNKLPFRGDETAPGDGGHRILRRDKLIRGAKRFFWIFLYLWAIYGLLMMHEAVVLARYHIPYTRWGFALVSALVLAKVMLVMEEFKVARGFDDKPLIYPILYKSVVFAVVFLAFYTLEETVGGLFRGQTVVASLPVIGGGTPLGVFIALVIASFALVPYFAFKEIGRALGERELRALLFTRGRKPVAEDPRAKLPLGTA